MTKIEKTLETFANYTGHGMILEIPLLDLREQQAQIDRLRAALREIAEAEPSYDYGDSAPLSDLARVALAYEQSKDMEK